MWEAPTKKDDRPEWAQRLNLPSHEGLKYAQALSWVVLGAFVLTYVAARAMSNPRALVRFAHEKTGV